MEINKPSADEVENRVNTIIPLIVYLRTQDIISYINKNYDWNVCNNTIRNYIKKAKSELLKDYKKHDKNILVYSYANLIDLYKKSMLNGDYKTCLDIQKEILKTFGLVNKVTLKEWELKEKSLKIEEKKAVNMAEIFGETETGDFIEMQLKKQNEQLKQE